MKIGPPDCLEEQWVLQFCHGYEPPFLDCARQYAALFSGSPYKVCTVYLTGTPDAEVMVASESEEVVFLNYASKEVRGLKLRAIRDFRKLVASRRFVFCIAHRFKPIYIALLGSRLPVFGIQHAFGVYSRCARRMFVDFFRHRLTLLGVSDAVRDDIRLQLAGWPDNRIHTLYNRVNVNVVLSELLSRDAARQALGLPRDGLIIGNVGRLHPDKDQATLIRGFFHARPRLPAGCRLVIMGRGPLEPNLRMLAEELGVHEHIVFLGQIPGGRRYFKAFDIFALTSDHEPFGMVLLEAMVAGVPIVSTDCGGASEVVRESGTMVPQVSPDELADALVMLTSMKPDALEALRAKMMQCLEERFSDRTARERFRSLFSLRNRRCDVCHC